MRARLTRTIVPLIAALVLAAETAGAQESWTEEGYRCFSATRASGRVIGTSDAETGIYPLNHGRCRERCETTPGCVAYNLIDVREGGRERYVCELLGSIEGHSPDTADSGKLARVCQRLAGKVPEPPPRLQPPRAMPPPAAASLQYPAEARLLPERRIESRDSAYRCYRLTSLRGSPIRETTIETPRRDWAVAVAECRRLCERTRGCIALSINWSGGNTFSCRLFDSRAAEAADGAGQFAPHADINDDLSLQTCFRRDGAVLRGDDCKPGEWKTKPWCQPRPYEVNPEVIRRRPDPPRGQTPSPSPSPPTKK